MTFVKRQLVDREQKSIESANISTKHSYSMHNFQMRLVHTFKPKQSPVFCDIVKNAPF